MLMIVIAEEVLQETADLPGVELSGVLGQRQHLVAAGLDGAGLMGGDVARFGGDYTLVGAQDGTDDRFVGLRAADEEFHPRAGAGARPADEVPGLFTVGILSVAGRLLEIGRDKPGEDGGVRALRIIAGKIEFGFDGIQLDLLLFR